MLGEVTRRKCDRVPQRRKAKLERPPVVRPQPEGRHVRQTGRIHADNDSVDRGRVRAPGRGPAARESGTNGQRNERRQHEREEAPRPPVHGEAQAPAAPPAPGVSSGVPAAHNGHEALPASYVGRSRRQSDRSG